MRTNLYDYLQNRIHNMLHSAFAIRSIQVQPNVGICASLWVKVKLVPDIDLRTHGFLLGLRVKM